MPSCMHDAACTGHVNTDNGVVCVFHSTSLDHTCGSIFEGINGVLSAFCETKPLSTAVGQRSTMVGLQRLYCEVCL